MPKETNAMLWGAILAVLTAILVAILNWQGTPSPLTLNPGQSIGLGFFWGWAAGELKNWLGRRKPR